MSQDRAGLTRTSPQGVAHVDGWSFGSAGRYAMRYTDADGHVVVPVEDSPELTRVFVGELHRVVGERRVPLSPEEEERLLPRITMAMQELVGDVELYEGDGLSRP